MLSISIQSFVIFLLSLYSAHALPPSSLTNLVKSTSFHHLQKRDVQHINQCDPPNWGFLASTCTRRPPSEHRAYRIICENPESPFQLAITPGLCPANTVCTEGPLPQSEPDLLPQELWGSAYCMGYENILRLAELGLENSASSASTHHATHTSSSSPSTTISDSNPSPNTFSSGHFILPRDSISSESEPSTLNVPHALHPRSSHGLAKRSIEVLNGCPPPYSAYDFVFSYCLPQSGSRQPYVIYCRTPPTVPYSLEERFELIHGECASDAICVQGPHMSHLEDDALPLSNMAYCLGFEEIVALVDHGLDHKLRPDDDGIDGTGNATSTAATSPPSIETDPPTSSKTLGRRVNPLLTISSEGWIDTCSPTYPHWTLLLSYCLPRLGSRSAYRKVCGFLATDQHGEPYMRYLSLDGECDDHMTCLDGPDHPHPPPLPLPQIPASAASSSSPEFLWGMARCLLWAGFEGWDPPDPPNPARERRQAARWVARVEQTMRDYRARGRQQQQQGRRPDAA